MWMIVRLSLCFVLVIDAVNAAAASMRNTTTSLFGQNHTDGTSQSWDRVLQRWLQQSSNTKIRGPRFFLLGVQKGGSTSLCDLLTQHRQVCPMTEKEPHFFIRDDLFNKGHDAYAAFWNGLPCPTDLSSGYIDCTPDYYRIKSVPQRMGQILDPKYKANKRAILVLRDPVAREYSLYGHHMRRCIEVINTVFREKKYDGSKTTPTQFWDKNKVIDIVKHSGYDCGALMDTNYNFYVPPAPGKITFSLATFRQYYESGHLHHRNSYYVDQIKNMLTYFGRNQLLVISFSDLVTHTPKVMNAIASHFGIPNTWGPNIKLPQENTAKDVNDLAHNRLDCFTQEKLINIYTPKNKELYAWFKAHPGPQYEPPFPPFEAHPTTCEK